MGVVAANRDLLTAALMGFTAGYTTSNTKVRFNTFGGMMTGNTVKLGISMQQGQWDWTGIYFLCVLNFALGTIAALFMLQKLGTARAQNAFLLVFCLCFLLVDAIALAVDLTPEEYNTHASAVSSLSAFALGGQNCLSQKAGIVKANTTFMTGNIQKMAEALWTWFDKRKTGGLKPSERRAAILLFFTWWPYVVGGVCGAAMGAIERFYWSLTPAAVLYAVGMASMLVEPPKKPKAVAAPKVTEAPTTKAEVAAPAPRLVEPADLAATPAAAAAPCAPTAAALVESELETGSIEPAVAAIAPATSADAGAAP